MKISQGVDERLPVYILAGFLGSGKTTLLGSILRQHDFSDSAVIINELGEIGLDHELVSQVSDNTVMLQGGCVCCTIREDIERTLQDLFKARDAGRIPPFGRLLIEMTGIAEPQPLIYTLHANPLAASRLDGPRVITVVDSVNGADTLEKQPEATAQVSSADVIVVSKRDLCRDDRLLTMIGNLNPWACVHLLDLRTDNVEPLFAGVPEHPETIAADVVGRFVKLTERCEVPVHARVHSLCLTLDQPLDWTGFGVWLTMLLHRHGQNVLRMKAILNVDGNRGPVVLQCAQHLVHPPEHLDQWPGDDRRSRLVMIVRDLDPARIEQSLKRFDTTAKLTGKQEGSRQYLPAGAGGSISGRPVKRPTAPGWLKG